MIQNDQNVTPNSQELTDIELVWQSQQGNLEAFTALYERHLPVVYNRVRYVIPEPDVEDVTQEIFIAMMKSLKSFQGNSRFSTWLRTLVNRRVADYYRNRNRGEVELAVDVSDADGTLPELRVGSGTASIDDAIVVQRALRALPEGYQEILLLRFVDGLQFHEIAQEQGQSLEATKSLFRRAVAAIRKQVEQPHA